MLLWLHLPHPNPSISIDKVSFLKSRARVQRHRLELPPVAARSNFHDSEMVGKYKSKFFLATLFRISCNTSVCNTPLRHISFFSTIIRPIALYEALSLRNHKLNRPFKPLVLTVVEFWEGEGLNDIFRTVKRLYTLKTREN